MERWGFWTPNQAASGLMSIQKKMAIFNSYVKLPEVIGNTINIAIDFDSYQFLFFWIFDS